ncbi:MAG: DedA family protein [Patescibacteria group bacterium]
MSALLTSLVSGVQDLVLTGGYWGVFAAAFLENFFPPIPSEVIFPLVGFTASTGLISLLGVILAGTGGALAGALFWYGMGAVLGRANLKVYMERWGRYLRIKFADIEKAERWFARYEGPAVFFGRLIPLVRTFISVPAGFVGMGLTRFVAYTFAGSFLWIGLLTVGGFWLGERWERIAAWVGTYESVVLAILILAVVILILRLLRVIKKV